MNPRTYNWITNTCVVLAFAAAIAADSFPTYRWAIGISGGLVAIIALITYLGNRWRAGAMNDTQSTQRLGETASVATGTVAAHADEATVARKDHPSEESSTGTIKNVADELGDIMSRLTTMLWEKHEPSPESLAWRKFESEPSSEALYRSAILYLLRDWRTGRTKEMTEFYLDRLALERDLRGGGYPAQPPRFLFLGPLAQGTPFKRSANLEIEAGGVRIILAENGSVTIWPVAKRVKGHEGLFLKIGEDAVDDLARKRRVVH